MLAVLGGLTAAAMFAGSTLLAARGARLVGAPSWLAGVMTAGLLVVAPFAIVAGAPSNLDEGTVVRLVVSGAGNVAGLLFAYTALRGGQVSVVAPILSTEGAIAAVLAVIGGEQLAPAAVIALGVITVGVVLVARTPTTARQGARTGALRAGLLSIAAACCFGASLYATGTLGTKLALVWALLPARAIGVATVAIPLAATRRLHMTRRAAPWVVLGGLCEVGGFAAFTLGARHGIAVSAVLASQFATVAAVVGIVVFRERLARLQVAGVVAVALGVAALAGLQA